MNSLKIKFLGLTGIILIVAIGLTTWYNLQHPESHAAETGNRACRLVAETIRNSVMTDMSNGRNEQVGAYPGQDQPGKGHQQPAHLRRNRAGFSPATLTEIGDLVATVDLLAYRTGNYTYTETSNGHENFSTIIPFENRPPATPAMAAKKDPRHSQSEAVHE